MKYISSIVMLLLSLIIFPLQVNAKSAWTNHAVPQSVEIVRGQGFVIFGAYGNNGVVCGAGDTIWIAISHPQYDTLYSMAISAMLAGKEIWGYAHVCTDYGWHGTTQNEITSAGALRMGTLP